MFKRKENHRLRQTQECIRVFYEDFWSNGISCLHFQDVNRTTHEIKRFSLNRMFTVGRAIVASQKSNNHVSKGKSFSSSSCSRNNLFFDVAFCIFCNFFSDLHFKYIGNIFHIVSVNEQSQGIILIRMKPSRKSSYLTFEI